MNDFYVNWKVWRDEAFGKFDSEEAAYFSAETRMPASAGLRVLEIGYGNGAFLGWAQSAGADVFGIEVSPSLLARARLLLGEDHTFSGLFDASLRTLAGTFSYIVAFDVVEHIPIDDLPSVFAMVRELLSPEGRCILRFPNGDSPFGRIHQHGDPTHVTTMGSEKLRYLAAQAGLEVESVRAPALPLHGVGLRRAINRWLLIIGRRFMDRAICLLYFGGRRIPLDPNYTAVLVKPPGSPVPALRTVHPYRPAPHCTC